MQSEQDSNDGAGVTAGDSGSKGGPATGGCLCGAIRYHCTHPLKTMVVCHCVDCQKSSGTGGGYSLRVPAETLWIDQGEPKAFDVTAESGDWLRRLFCGECGSQLFHQRQRLTNFITIKAGSLDHSDYLTAAMHIWTSSAPGWVMINPKIPNHHNEFSGLRHPKLPE